MRGHVWRGLPLNAAGTRPGGRGTFSLRGEKVPKEARPLSRPDETGLPSLRQPRAGDFANSPSAQTAKPHFPAHD